MKITIHITGPQGSGKSAVASAIAEILTEAGITVLHDGGGSGVTGLSEVPNATHVEITAEQK